jgi:hypothetical protein
MTDTLRLIALTGRAGAGKDSVAATLVQRLHYQNIAFADALRAEIAQAWRIDPRMLQDPRTKWWPIPALAVSNCGETAFTWAFACEPISDLTEPRSPRWIMQRWGDFQRDRHGNDYYAQIVIRWLKRQIGSGWTRFVVTDMRFGVEMAALSQVGDRVRFVRVARPKLPPPTDRHASETELLRAEVDYDLVNDGTLADLERATLRMERDLFGSGARDADPP